MQKNAVPPRVQPDLNEDPPYPPASYAWYVVGVLMIVYILNFVDRQILSLILDPVKKDLGVSDTAMGLLTGTAFGLFYAVLGVPFGWLADRRNRRGIIAAGVTAWSILTAACGVAHHYWQLFILRMGVGIGEATLSPAAYSIITDYFPRNRLATAISVYGMGIYIGTGMAFMLGGLVVKYALTAQGMSLPVVGEVHPWQVVFLVVGLPGLLVALLLFSVKEPLRRGMSVKRGNVTFREFLAYVSENRAAVVNHHLGFAMVAFMGYACAAWVPSLFTRIHQWDRPTVGFWYGLVSMVFGSMGIVFGGVLADRLSQRGYRDAKVRCGLISAAIALPLSTLFPLVSNGAMAMALLAPLTFAQAMSFGCAPAAVQEMMPANMRGQGGAMYLLVINFISIGFAALTVGAITDNIFQNDLAVGKSLAIVNCISCAIGAALLYRCLRHFVDSLDRLHANR